MQWKAQCQYLYLSNDQGDRCNLIDENSETSSSNNLATNSGSILLQTAYTKISNLSTQKEANVCVLFEMVSQGLTSVMN